MKRGLIHHELKIKNHLVLLFFVFAFFLLSFAESRLQTQKLAEKKQGARLKNNPFLISFVESNKSSS
jgi:hypothetical protein